MRPKVISNLHIPRNAIATNAVRCKTAVITQVFECLGIAFTYNLCFRVFIKHPDQLPGVSIIPVFIRGSLVVIGQFTYFIFIINEFFQIIICRVCLNNVLCIVNCTRDGLTYWLNTTEHGTFSVRARDCRGLSVVIII